MSTLNEFIDQSQWPTSILVEDSGWIFDPDIVDGLPVWEWPDPSGLRTRVVLEPGARRRVHWQIWDGEEKVSDRPTETFGVAGALHLIANWRIYHLDEREIRGVLREAAYPERCETCPACDCPGMN